MSDPVFWAAAITGALCFATVGWLLRGAWDTARRAHRRPGYVTAPLSRVENWCCPDRPDHELISRSSWEKAERQFADALDTAAGR